MAKPQRLNIEKTDSHGNKVIVPAHVIRSWQDASGAMLLLYANGSYGYRNGEPVRDEREFDIIASPVQRRAALAWWQRAGKDISQAYYSAKTEQEERRMGDFLPAAGGRDSEYDAVLYTRSPSADAEDVSGPFSWMDLFQNRPDWWGQALSIQFGDFVYRQAEAALAGPPATIEEKDAKLERAETPRRRAASAGGRQGE